MECRVVELDSHLALIRGVCNDWCIYLFLEFVIEFEFEFELVIGFVFAFALFVIVKIMRD